MTVLGIDVGGTKIAAGVVTFPSGRVELRQTMPTRPERGGEAVLEDTVVAAESLAAAAKEAGLHPSAVGLGLCELVDPRGRILSQSTLAWHEDQAQRRLRHLGPVFLEADVRAAARAEALFGAGRPHRVFLYVTVGTGISSCLMLDGAPYLGARGATGTMASSPLSLVCERCGLANHRTLEQIAAGPGLVARFNELEPGAAVSAEHVLAAAQAGNAHAVEVVRSAGEALGAAVGWLVNVLDPEAVVVGGGLGLSDGPYWESLVASARRHCWAEVHRDLPILRAETGPNAGVIGAAAAAWARQVLGAA